MLRQEFAPDGRTIVEKDRGVDRTSKRTNELRKQEFDRLRVADCRARKKARDRLPKQIEEASRRLAAMGVARILLAPKNQLNR